MLSPGARRLFLAELRRRYIPCVNFMRICWFAQRCCFYTSFAWRRKQAIEIDPMLAVAGWVAAELRPPKR
jgi:hypothetical protein